MTRFGRNCAVSVIPAILVGLTLPAVAQHAREKADDTLRAQRMAQLLAEGQLALRDATALAEKHTRGIALDVSCEVGVAPGGKVTGVPTARPTSADRGGPHAQEQQSDASPSEPIGDRLMYSICCFHEGKIQRVTIDGKTREVISSKECTKLGGDEPAPRG